MKHSDRLKAQMLRAAVQDNADTIADRLPGPLRPARRLLTIWGPRAALLTLPACVIAGSALVAHRLLAAQPIVVVPPRYEPARDPIGVGVPESPPESPSSHALFSRPLRARALALGVRRAGIDPGH